HQGPPIRDWTARTSRQILASRLAIGRTDFRVWWQFWKRDSSNEQRQATAQGYHSGWWIGHTALSDHAGRVEAIDANLRQADDLLPAVCADASRYPRDCGY